MNVAPLKQTAGNDYAEAGRFLNLLNPQGRVLTFQTFDDNKARSAERLTRVIPSPPSASAALQKLNREGAGVFVTVNETDGTGRKGENIVRVRAVWQEDDGGFDGEFPLQPSMVVESSPGKFHRYWLVAGDWPADEQGKVDHAAVLERMVESYGSDKGAKGINRVLRVPGFLHQKTEPHRVRLVEANGKRYTRDEILNAFPPIERKKPEPRQQQWKPRDDDEEQIRDALNYVNADDRDVWLQIGMALKAELGEEGRPLWDDWSRKSAKYNERDQEKVWRSFRGNGIRIGTLFFDAQRAGWQHEPRFNGNGADPFSPSAGGNSSSTDTEATAEPPWPEMDEAAYHGLAGDVVRFLDPHTEADPVAILLQFLTAFGNVVGSNPYYQVESDRHHANLFAVLVGNSAKARKGTSMRRALAVIRGVDDTWYESRRISGLSSGEGLIHAVRDPVEKWDAKEQCQITVDQGVIDKRLFVHEPELAGALAAMERHGNTLSPVIRNAWDGQTLQTATKNSPLKATGAHISITAHITVDETRARLTRTDLANGFANRFLFVCVRRSKHLPHGGNFEEAALFPLQERVRAAIGFAQHIGRVRMTDQAVQAWSEVYEELSADHPGLVGAVIARAEAQVIRLSLLYALLDQSDTIGPEHLEAAVTVWSYCEESAMRIFGDSLGNVLADEILRALKASGEAGMTRWEIINLFQRHRTADQIGAALVMLKTHGRARMEKVKSEKGRSVETWFSTGGAQP